MAGNRERVSCVFPTSGDVPAEHLQDEYKNGCAYLIDGEVRAWSGPKTEVVSPVCFVGPGGKPRRRSLGRHADLPREVALEALAAAGRAWDNGRGAWPTMSTRGRLDCMEAFVARMRPLRTEMARLLMWEIGKPWKDSLKEFDRTVQYIDDTIRAVKTLDRDGSRFNVESDVLAMIRRAPLGRVLCMGPFNYPLNESFTTLIPALIMGNTVVVKGPRFGMLCMLPLLDAFATSFPRGVVNVLNGQGSVLAGPLMESGDIDVLAFIGSSRVGDILKKAHPKPHRLRSVLGLDAKNPAIVLPDADVDEAVRASVEGALTFNGQRCTAIKIIFVHESLVDRFLSGLAAAVEALSFGMPWEDVVLTPMPEPDKAKRLTAMAEDAVSKGARLVNPTGLAANESFVFPAVVFPVDPSMELYHVEQFGPILPVASYRDIDEIYRYFELSNYGQQASVFGRDPAALGPFIDTLSNQVCRINLNTQCQRGPDVYPFTGRKDSAEGTLSVSDALRVFSIRSMVASRYDARGRDIVTGIISGRTSKFLRMDYMF